MIMPCRAWCVHTLLIRAGYALITTFPASYHRESPHSSSTIQRIAKNRIISSANQKPESGGVETGNLEPKRLTLKVGPIARFPISNLLLPTNQKQVGTLVFIISTVSQVSSSSRSHVPLQGRFSGAT